jgi:hypothetical protein
MRKFVLQKMTVPGRMSKNNMKRTLDISNFGVQVALIVAILQGISYSNDLILDFEVGSSWLYQISDTDMAPGYSNGEFQRRIQLDYKDSSASRQLRFTVRDSGYQIFPQWDTATLNYNIINKKIDTSYTSECSIKTGSSYCNEVEFVFGKYHLSDNSSSIDISKGIGRYINENGFEGYYWIQSYISPYGTQGFKDEFYAMKGVGVVLRGYHWPGRFAYSRSSWKLLEHNNSTFNSNEIINKIDGIIERIYAPILSFEKDASQKNKQIPSKNWKPVFLFRYKTYDIFGKEYLINH